MPEPTPPKRRSANLAVDPLSRPDSPLQRHTHTHWMISGVLAAMKAETAIRKAMDSSRAAVGSGRRGPAA